MINNNAPDLNHSHTPLFLRILNKHIIDSLVEEEGDDEFSTLSHLISIRHKIILRELKRLPEEERKEFARNENDVQRHLDDMANKLLKAYKDKLLEFTRAKAALKRYE